jgi:hypothetical protein
MGQKNGRTDSRPTLFNLEDNNLGLERVRPPKDNVLDAVLKQVETDELNSEIEQLSREQKRALFEAVRVDLGPALEEAYLVHGKPPMIGADCEWFWVVRVKEKKAGVVLFSNGLAIELRKKPPRGIETSLFPGPRRVMSAPGFIGTAALPINCFESTQKCRNHEFEFRPVERAVGAMFISPALQRGEAK